MFNEPAGVVAHFIIITSIIDIIIVIIISPIDNLDTRISIFVLSQNLLPYYFIHRSYTWFWGPFKISGIYRRHFKVFEDSQRVFLQPLPLQA